MDTVQWWRDPAIRLALATVVLPGLYRIVAATGVELPFSQETATVFIVDGLMLAGGAIWIIRRVKKGNDPGDPAKKVVL